MNIKEVRKEISELLVKWSMPTRQAFINELSALIEKERASAVRSFGKWFDGGKGQFGDFVEEYLKTLESEEI